MGAAAQSKAGYKAVKAEAHTGPSSGGVVHITPTTMKAGSTSMEVGGDVWNARGYDLKTLISEIYGVDERRIDLAGDDSGARWDVSLQLPREVDWDAMQQMLRSALEKKFGVTITPESQQMDVYVLTAPNGPGAALRRHVPAERGADGDNDAGEITYFGKDCAGSASGGIAASAGTISELGRTLEPDLDRLLVDETGLKGSYDFKIGTYASEDELFKLMRDELGIVVTPAQRSVTVLSVRPAAEGQDVRAGL